MKRLLITGASSLLGKKFIELYDNDYIIYKIYRSKENLKKNEFNVDLRDRRKIEELLRKIEKIDVLLHFSAQTTVWKSIKNPTEDIESNIISTLNLLEIFKDYGLKKFIFTSSEAVFGNQVSPDEFSNKEPRSPYGISKCACENYLTFYKEKYNLPTYIVRPSFLIDFHMTRNPLYDILTGYKQKEINLFQSTNSEFNFISTEKVSSTINDIIFNKINVSELNIVNYSNTKLRDVLIYLKGFKPDLIVNETQKDIRQTLNSHYTDIKETNKTDIYAFCEKYLEYHGE